MSDIKSDAKKICVVVTLHGIGFEAAPDEKKENSGYADPLHAHLHRCIGPMLSDDPERKRDKPGENGAIYVQSLWPDKGDKKASREKGLARLDGTLVSKNKSVSHVALVYSNLEATGPAVGAALIALLMSIFSVGRYASISGLARLLVTDIKAAIFRKRSLAQKQLPISSLPRKDMTAKHKGREKPVDTSSSPGPLRTFRSLENDVACYICHNDERERVRSFVREALMRLASRKDVGQIILNTHSNGTVIAFDVLSSLPKETVDKIKVFVTAGSPLRKYVDLFHWGTEFRCHYRFMPWYNFWDELDPVADPLEPPLTWRVRDKLLSPYATNLFSRIEPDTEVSCCLPVKDWRIDNVKYSPDGVLKAHNYWDNEKDFVPKLACIVTELIHRDLCHSVA
jgi:hypothetical protein